MTFQMASVSVSVSVSLALFSTAMIAAGCPSEPEPEPANEAGADAGPLDNQGGKPPFVVVDGGVEADGGVAETPCRDDAAQDDTQATAQPLTAGTPASARLCGTNDDWYAIDVAGNDCALVASLALVADAEGVLNPLSDLDLLLVDEAGQVVGAGVGTGAREGINVRVRAGRHALRVRGTANEDVDYVVSADVVCAADAVCPADDDDEDNDTLATATLLEPTLPHNAAACGSDVDFFALPASDCMIDVDVSFVHSRGDIDLELHDGTPANAIASSASTRNRERLTRLLTDSATARVFLYNGVDANTGNGYRIVVDEVCAAEQVCPGDDVFEDNDTAANAVTLEANSAVLATVCGADVDFFRYRLTAGCTTSFAADFSHAAGDIDVQLLSDAGAVLASALSIDDDEALTYTATTTGNVVLRVFGLGGASNSYQLTATTTCP